MKHLKAFGLSAILIVFAIDSIAQSIIYDTNLGGAQRTLRSGTYSNRTADLLNLNNPSNGSAKTYAFWDMTSWDSKFYDGKTFTNGAITTGTNTLSSATANFASADVGKTIDIRGAGVAGIPLVTTITAIITTSQVSLLVNASTTVSAATIRYGAKPTYTEGHYTTYSNGNYEMNYRLMFPVGYSQVENYKYPMIIMMHGAGERGNCWNSSCYGNLSDSFSTNPQYRNNDMNLTHGGREHMEAIYNSTTGSNGKKAEDPTLPTRAFPGFIVFPQNESGWTGSTQYEQAYRIVELLTGAYNIDPDRIYIHGLSNGAAATWEVLRARPDLFAAILPMSATISHAAEIFTTETPSTPLGDIEKAVPIPAWIFQGGTDGNPTPNNTNQLVAKLKAAGAVPRYTLYPTVGHGTWGFAYAEAEFFSWMLKQNKRNINVLYGDSTLCATDNSGVKLALSVGFLAYQWEQDGVVMPGFTTSTVTVTQPGAYRARFSRISATPIEAEWNTWSKPVVIKEAAAITPTITATGTSHLPDINGDLSVRINGPTTKDLVKLWFKDGVQTTSYNAAAVPQYFAPYTDTASYTIRADAGRFSLKTIPLNACSSLESNSIYVTLATPTTLIAPANLQAVVTAPGSVQLFWTDNTPNETGFEISRSTNLGGPYDFFKLVSEGTVSYSDTGLMPGTVYYYQLRAVNNTAASPYSGEIFITTTADPQAPTAPQNLISGARTLTSIALSWTASTDNTGVSSYTIYNGATIVASNITTTTYNATGLTTNSNFLFTVKAVDFAGNFSQPSNQLLATTTFTGLNYSYSAVNVTLLTQPGNNWNTPELTGTCTSFDLSLRKQDDFFNFKFEGYLILPAGSYNFRTQSDDGSAMYMGADGVSAFPFDYLNPTTNRIFNNDGLHGCGPGAGSIPSRTFIAGVPKPIAVIMFEQAGGECLTVEYKLTSSGTWLTLPSSALNSGSAPTLTPPLAPAGLAAVAGGMSSINLTWTAASGATSYEIYRSLNNSTFTIIASAATNSYSDTGLLPSTLYYYKLKSINNTTGSSVAYSSTVNATTTADLQAPTVPLNVAVLSSNYTSAGLLWNVSTDNVSVAGYKIFANSTLLGTSVTNTYYTTSLLPGTLYNFTVSAYDNGTPANESAQSTVVPLTTIAPLIFYSKPSVSLDLLSSWTVNNDGTGASPTSFSYNGQYFTIQNPQTLSNSLTIGGNVSRVIVSDGVTLNISQPLTGTIKVGNASIVNLNVDYQPVFETIASSSTINFNTYSSIPIATYGNLTLNGSGLKTVAAGTVDVQGNLTLANGVGIKGASSNGSTVKITGDLITAATVATASADNRVTLQFTDAVAHNMSVSSNQSFYKIIANTGASVTFAGNANTLNLGSLNGGGIDLANGSSLVVGNNTLVLTDKAGVNPTNSTGKFSINNGSIQLTTTATTDANFYFVAGNNKIQDFTLQSTAGGIAKIREAVEIYNGLKINSGTLSAGGFITIKSSATASAAIQQIASGSITGAVAVERYMTAKKVYRYLSSPVMGATIAEWQAYIPITGNFTGASTGFTSNPSMYIYTYPSFIAYPTTDNTAILQTGRGYATFVREGVNPTTFKSTGVPNQGTISFTPLLTGGTGIPADGWNLLGNPYASDIVWSNTGWTSSGIGNVISVRENDAVGGGFTWRIWDRSSATGNLTGGKIPAGQAFWAQASIASPTLTVSESAKTVQSASNNTTFYRVNSVTNTNSLSIKLDNGSKQDYTYINLTDDGVDNYDKVKDGAKRANSFFNLSTFSADGEDLAFNNTSNSFCEKTININLANVAPGNYSLQFDNLDNFNLAGLQLIDAFLNTTTPLNTNTPSFNISITADAASFVNRFSIKLTRPTIVTSQPLITQKDSYCRSDQFILLSIPNSQAGVNYEAINSSLAVISEKVVGTGETVQLKIAVKDLLLIQNTIQVRSNYSGCTVVTMANSKIITILELPSVVVPSDISTCAGSKIDLAVTGTGKTYQWFNETHNQSMNETSNVLRVLITDPITSIRVTAISDAGCTSESKNFFIRSDSLAIPKISIASNGILETDGTNGVLWFLNGYNIIGADSSKYTPIISGRYTVKTSNVYCTQESAPVDFLVTGIGENSKGAFSLIVYPNPSETGTITITGNSQNNNQLHVLITDILGKELITRVLSLDEYAKGIAIETKLPGGVYIVRINQNNVTLHQKIIIR